MQNSKPGSSGARASAERLSGTRDRDRDRSLLLLLSLRPGRLSLRLSLRPWRATSGELEGGTGEERERRRQGREWLRKRREEWLEERLCRMVGMPSITVDTT